LKTRALVVLAIFPSVALGLLNDLYLEPLSRLGAPWFWTADLFQFVVVPATVVLLLIKAGPITPSQYGLRPFAPTRSTAEIVGLCLFMCVVFWIAYEPVKQIAYRFLWRYAGTFGYGSMLPKAFWPRLPVVLYLSLTAAFVEEAVFRGLPWL
jgi:hypothetical protein